MRCLLKDKNKFFRYFINSFGTPDSCIYIYGEDGSKLEMTSYNSTDGFVGCQYKNANWRYICEAVKSFYDDLSWTMDDIS